jgi:hypothetical protein
MAAVAVVAVATVLALVVFLYMEETAALGQLVPLLQQPEPLLLAAVVDRKQEIQALALMAA